MDSIVLQRGTTKGSSSSLANDLTKSQNFPPGHMHSYLQIVEKGDKLANPADPIEGRVQLRQVTKDCKQVTSYIP